MADGTIRCIDLEIPFDIPDSWAWVRMGAIGSWGAGATPLKGNPKYYGGNILWLRTGELNDGVVYDTEIKITELAIKECSLRLNQIGDVLIAMYGATIGKVAIVGNEMTTNQACCACSPILMSNLYLFYFLMASKEDFTKKGEGGAQPNISREKLIGHLMPLPPICEQKRIVECIQFILPYVELYSQHKQKLDKLNNDVIPNLRKSILQEAIQGRLVPQIASEGTTEELLTEIRAEKIRLVKEGKLKKSAIANESRIFRGEDNRYYEQIGSNTCDITDLLPFDIPKNWRWCRLSDIIQLLSGRDLESNEYNDRHLGIPYMTGASNFLSGKLLVNRWTENPVTISKTGDLLITCKGTIGQMAFNSIGDVHIARQIMAIRGIEINLHYLKYFLESTINTLQKQAKSMIPGISREVLLNALYPLPPIAEQNRIVKRIDELLHHLKQA